MEPVSVAPDGRFRAPLPDSGPQHAPPSLAVVGALGDQDDAVARLVDAVFPASQLAPPGQPVVLDLPIATGGGIRGTVRRARGGAPVPGVVVLVRRLHPRASDGSLADETPRMRCVDTALAALSAVSGSDGAFAYFGLPDAAFQVLPDASEQRLQTALVGRDVRQGVPAYPSAPEPMASPFVWVRADAVASVDVRASPFPRVALRLTDERGATVGRASCLVAAEMDGTAWLTGIGDPGDDGGRLVVHVNPTLPAGPRLSLLVVAEGHEVLVRPLSRREFGTTVALQLPGPGAPIAGCVVGADGKPCPGAELTFVPTTDSGLVLALVEHTVRCDADGRFRTEVFPAGTRCALSVEDPATRRSLTTEVVAGTAECVLRLTEDG